jgi:hypothetical protein
MEGKMTEQEFAALTPSQLIKVALKDLEVAERSDQTSINMSFWVLPRCSAAENRCTVCLAGAVMVGSLGASTSEHGTPEDYFNIFVRNRLYAIDQFRKGEVSSGLNLMDVPLPKGMPTYVFVPHYGFHTDAFKRAMADLVDLLESYNL